MSYIAVRVKPLKKWSDVANAARHGRRDDPAKHVDRSRSHLNRHWAVTGSCEFEEQDEAADIELAFSITAGLADAKWRKGAIVGTEMLFIASPQYFHGVEADAPLNTPLVNKWAEDCLTAAHAKFPGQIAAARLDMDETTPHLSVFMLPMYEKAYEGEKRRSERPRRPRKAISHNQVFGEPEKLVALQDWIAVEMIVHGHGDLRRGRSKAAKGPDHLTPAEGRRLIAEASKEAERILEKAKQEVAQMRAAQTAEVEILRSALKQREALIDTILSVLREAVPSMFEKLKALINEAWSKHALNPKRTEEPKASAPRSARPPSSPGM